MLYDIRVAKPAFDIKEGIFYDKIPGFAIKVGKKDKDGNGISNIIIYENQYSLQDNIIVAETGTMKISDDKKFLEFDLKNGWRYQEKGPYNSIQTDFYRLGFKNYKKVFDLSSFAMMKTPDSIFKGSQQMLNISQLSKSEDSLKKVTSNITDKRMYNELTIFFQFGKNFMKGWQGQQFNFNKNQQKYGDLIPDTAVSVSYVKAADKITMLKGSLDVITTEYTQKIKELRLFQIEWNKKFTLSIACLVLFIIGAPLGSIIRKGGLGMPLVIAVIFFLIWHLINMFGEKFVRQDVLSPLSGIWMSTYLLLPVGFFLVYKAMNDSQLFNNEFYFRAFRKIRIKFNVGKRNKQLTPQ
jgi:lipopolysaccharide export system permease protein